MADPHQFVLIHGLNGSSQGEKAALLRGLYPEMLIPDFPGSLEERMEILVRVLAAGNSWTLIGSSFGGLMAALYASRFPDKLTKLVLLAPALVWPDFAQNPPGPIHVPTVVYHGTRDTLIPISLVRSLAEQVFTQLTFNEVDDDHGLYATVHGLDWRALLEEN